MEQTPLIDGHVCSHAERGPSSILQKCTMFLTVLLIIFQIFVAMYLFNSGYAYNDKYDTEAQKIMDAAVKDVQEGLTNNDDETVMYSNLPETFLTPYQLPRYCQYDRGTCWALATIGILEQSYRANGIKNNFLQPNEYVRLSPQAYAIDVMNQCKLHQEACPSKRGPFNSTEGGFVEWLYAFTDLYDKIMPEAACPYQEENDGQWKCDNKEEKQTSNPIKMSVDNIITKRSISDVKKLLVDYNAPVAFDSSLIIGEHAIPAAGHEMLRAFVKKVDSCPDNENEECLYIPQHEMNSDGEFFIAEVNAASEGGHAMNIVGYNDNFVNKDGTKGAFIVRNSWLEAVYQYDTREWIFPESDPKSKFNRKSLQDDPPPTPRNYYRGSHSTQYILQTISEWDERMICPNPNNIQNWDSCVTLSSGPTKFGIRKNIDSTSACFNETFVKEYVENYRRPLEFACLNQFTDQLCSREDFNGSRFFLTHKSQSTKDPNLVNFCMLKVNRTNIEQQHEFCANDVPFDYVEYLFMPVQEQMEMLKNSDDHCGFHIWPYSYIEKNQKYRGFFDVIHFDISWDDRSYVKNTDSGFNYDYIKQSTGVQSDFPPFLGPEPHQERFTE